MCLNEALRKAKTGEELKEIRDTHASLMAAAEAEDAGDKAVYCRMSGKHGSWIKTKSGWLCASCESTFPEREPANDELLSQNHQWRTYLDTEMISCDRCGRDERMSYADKHKGEKCNGRN